MSQAYPYGPALYTSPLPALPPAGQFAQLPNMFSAPLAAATQPTQYTQAGEGGVMTQLEPPSNVPPPAVPVDPLQSSRVPPASGSHLPSTGVQPRQTTSQPAFKWGPADSKILVEVMASLENAKNKPGCDGKYQKTLNVKAANKFNLMRELAHETEDDCKVMFINGVVMWKAGQTVVSYCRMKNKFGKMRTAANNAENKMNEFKAVVTSTGGATESSPGASDPHLEAQAC